MTDTGSTSGQDQPNPPRVDAPVEASAATTQPIDTASENTTSGATASGTTASGTQADGDVTAPVAADPGHLGATQHFASGTAVAAGDGSAFRRRRSGAGLLLPAAAIALVAALIGGGVGAGVAVAVSSHGDAGTTGAVAPAGNVIAANPASATAITAVAAKASPSVVTISVSASSEAGTGSGIVLTDDGYVLTNNHVVTLDGDSSSGTISVTTNAGRIYTAKIVGTDPTNDLAVIKLNGASGLQPASFGDSSKLNVGDAAIAIGAPLGLSGTVTNGIVSALNRSITVASSAVPQGGSDDSSGGDGSGEGSPFNFWNFGGGTDGQGGTTQAAPTQIALSVVQTDAAINPGNSGGALLNSQGQIIGVNVAIAGTGSQSTAGSQSGNIGVGFAIPSNIAHRIAMELMDGKKATHGLLGVQPSDPTSSSTVSGATVAKLTAGGAAEKAGLKVGDVITAFNGVAVADSSDLTAQVRALAGGASSTLTYDRNGTSHTVKVTLGTYSS
ncbi:S1C family serine protease [uncultured Amnibacterium sp.]|uniref:S1C family serine protease n=1 Tax=uncultured Amnibacterium sp. TaxID=1631851 RepID=UPI0035CB2C28